MSGGEQFKFRLYTACGTQNSARALADLTALCEAQCPGRYEIEVVDALRHSQRAKADNVRLTPTLIMLSPAPGGRIVGSLHGAPNLFAARDMQIDAA